MTVGSTKFDQLVAKILSGDSIELLTNKLEFTRLVIQAGASRDKHKELEQQVKKAHPKLDIELYDYKPTISVDISRADLVVGHAGAGTALEVLRAGKRLLVIENDSLMDNHQAELAEQLALDGYVIRGNIANLQAKLEEICDPIYGQMKPFPAKDRNKFATIFSNALEQM